MYTTSNAVLSLLLTRITSIRWSCPLPESEVPQDVIRLLMLRDSTTKGRKLLFDSMTTIRDDFSNKNLRKISFEDYDQITDGYGYKVNAMPSILSKKILWNTLNLDLISLIIT